MLSRLKRMKKNKKGFTLIELIVVISILAVLAILIVPKVLGFVNQAKVAALDSNARMLYNTTSLVISQDLITLPGADAKLTWDELSDDTTGNMAKYIDDWPTEADGETALVVEIDKNGAIEIQDSNGHLIGATIP